MSEPLTNKKRFKLFYLKIGGIERSGLAQDNNGNLIDVEDIKSALEHLKSKIKGCMTNKDVQEEIDKAFPAIYEVEK